MSSNLLIVESPSKVKTISSILGKDYKIMSCNGHIRDLPKKGIGIDIDNEFMPVYEVPTERKGIIKSLKDAAKKSNMVWLATDEDREGEAISWHLKQALGLSDAKIQRITFNEITKKAVLGAINNPKKINQDLVDAQQARRILDRLVGFELSPVLWKKLSGGLSAGRVQSVATKLVVEREREIENFKAKTSYPVNAVFSKEGIDIPIKAKLKTKYEKPEEVTNFLTDCIGSKFKVSHVEKKQGKRSPSAPFTTSTLQQEAAKKFGFPVASTMRVAQALYEAGKITYMRTDSIRLSDQAISESKQAIEKLFGAEYHQSRQFKNKTANAQEAHEAIRPTNFNVKSAGNSSGEQKLYELIWKRTLASQMADVKLNKTNAQIEIEKHQKNIFVATGEEIVFDGFLKIYENKESEGDENSDMLPPLVVGEELFAEKIFSKETRERHPARYAEASLVKALEEKGIGRPSTYVSIITTIQKRNYVEIKDKEPEQITVNFFELNRGDSEFKSSRLHENYGGDKKKMFPTDTGRLVNDFLEENFTSIMKFDFTASVEKEFDEVALGKKKYTEMLRGFYTPFNKNIKLVSETGERINFQKQLGIDPKTKKNIYARIGTYGSFLQLGETPKKEGEKKPQYFKVPQEISIETLKLEEALEIISTSEKKLGIDPKTGYDLTVKYGKFGPYIQMTDPKGKAKPRNVGIGNLSPKDVTLEQALKLLELPKNLGEFEGEIIETNKGRFGPYVKYQGQFISFPKDAQYTPLNITKEQAIEIIENKKEEDRKKYIHIFDDGMKVALGKKSPYIVYNKKIYRLQAGEDPQKMTHEDFIQRVPTYKKKK